jgi:hypothetical protein
MTPPPPGTGLPADGKGLVHIMKAGNYRFINATVTIAQLQERTFLPSTFTPIKASGVPEWIKPDGTREVIPTIYLYPPFSK